jgi:hypothetical protein
MALNVNIIGRDSEGNLRALKVNSEGNLDFGQLETEIQAVKDNQGRLYGKYGEAWIPVKVDSEGRPIISQGPAGTEPWLVQLSGTMVSSGLLANRPLASAVPPGFSYYSWDAPEGQEMAYSDGTNWVVKS